MPIERDMNFLAVEIAKAEGFSPKDVRRVLEVATDPMHCERLRSLLDEIDKEQSYERGPERLELFAETCTIYGCKERKKERVADDFGMTDVDAIQFAASVTYGERSIVVIQQESELPGLGEPRDHPEVFVYIYNEEPALGESSMVFYQAPNILGSI